MRSRSGVAFALAGVLCIGLVFPVSSADHDPLCAGALAVVELGTDTLYVDDRDDGGIWVYRENGVAAGLQLGGDIAGVIVDPCGGHPEIADDLVAHVPAAP